MKEIEILTPGLVDYKVAWDPSKEHCSQPDNLTKRREKREDEANSSGASSRLYNGNEW